MIRRYATVIAALMSIAPPLYGRPSEYQTNVREACRAAVAGGYLKAYDEREKLKTYGRGLRDQVGATAAAVKKAKRAFDAAKTAAERATFDLNLAEKRDETAATLQTFEAQLKDYQDLLSEAEQTLTKATEVEAQMKQRIAKVFVFERMEDKADGGYPIHLAYKAACPKFRHVCALPRGDAQNLLAIELEGAPPEACVRYASLSKITP